MPIAIWTRRFRSAPKLAHVPRNPFTEVRPFAHRVGRTLESPKKKRASASFSEAEAPFARRSISGRRCPRHHGLLTARPTVRSIFRRAGMGLGRCLLL